MMKLKPEYKPLVQMPYCCGPCSFQWVLHRRGYWIDQEEIAKATRLKIPKEYQKKFRLKMLVAKEPKDNGVKPGTFHSYLNKLLKKKKIPLSVKRFSISEINPRKLIMDNLKAGNDIMLSVHGRPFKRYDFDTGHAMVLSEFDPRSGYLILGDPSQNHSKFWRVKLDKVVEAMDPRFDGSERGFLIVSKNI